MRFEGKGDLGFGEMKVLERPRWRKPLGFGFGVLGFAEIELKGLKFKTFFVFGYKSSQLFSIEIGICYWELGSLQTHFVKSKSDWI